MILAIEILPVVYTSRMLKLTVSLILSYRILETYLFPGIKPTFGDNHRFFSYKYNIGYHIWMLSFNELVKCI